MNNSYVIIAIVSVVLGTIYYFSAKRKVCPACGSKEQEETSYGVRCKNCGHKFVKF